jgi:hypothetical protein
LRSVEQQLRTVERTISRVSPEAALIIGLSASDNDAAPDAHDGSAEGAPEKDKDAGVPAA